jgi:hypothetical protein
MVLDQQAALTPAHTDLGNLVFYHDDDRKLFPFYTST